MDMILACRAIEAANSARNRELEARVKELEAQLIQNKLTPVISTPSVIVDSIVKIEPRDDLDSTISNSDGQSECSHFVDSQAAESNRSERTSVRSSDGDSLGSHLDCYTLSDVTPTVVASTH